MKQALSLLVGALLAAACGSAVGAEAGSEGLDLTELSIEELMNLEISVASKRPEMLFEAPAVVVVVPRSEFEVYGDRTLFQLLQRQPSIYTRSSFVYADSMAGFRGDMSAHSETHTLLLLNGRPIRESAQAIDSPIYMTFPVDFLDGVELIRGPGSVLYGTNAFSGIINLKTRPVPEQPELSFSSMAGSYGYYDTTITGAARFGEVGFIGSIRVGGQEGWRYRMTDALGVYGEDDVREQNVSAAAHLECHRFTLDVFGSNMDAFALGVQPFWSDADQELRNKRLFVNAGYEVPLHERARLDLNLTYNLQENDMFSPFTPRIGTNTSDVLGEVTLFANPTDALNLVVGYLQEYRSNYAPDEDHFQSIPPYDYSPKSAYAQGDYAIGDKAKLIAGTQWNESPQGKTDLISRYGVIVTPTERWGVKLLRGEAFRAPIALESRLDDPPILVGNENLMPETVTTYDAQLFYHDERTYAAVTYFHSAFDRQILFDTNTSDPMTYMNGGEQTFEGIEFEFKRFLTTNWHLLGSYMRQQDKSDEGLNRTVVPEDMVKFGTGCAWDYGTAAIFVTHYGTPPIIESPVTVNPQPEAVSLLSANVRLDVSERLGLRKGQSFVTFRAENILDEEVYVPTLAFTGSPNSFPYGSGRAFFVGLEISF